MPVTRPTDPVEREAAQRARSTPRSVDATRPTHTAARGGNLGTPVPAPVRSHIAATVGVDLSTVRVRTDPVARAQATDLQARAFTLGRTIHLGPSSSPADVSLMTHEATHVAQQERDPGLRRTIMREFDLGIELPDISVEDVIPDWVLDGVRDAAAALPGYPLLTQIVGSDPITGRHVEASPRDMLVEILSYGPFSGALGPVLDLLDVVDDLVALVRGGLARHDLTLSRLQRDIDAAWDEFSVSGGIEGNLAIVRRYVAAMLADVTAFVTEVAGEILQRVREAAVDAIEPLLQADPIGPVWDLAVKALHYDPLRGTPLDVPTVEILADFLRLIGEDQRLEQMQERGTLQQTADWIDEQIGAFSDLLEQAQALFSDAWAALSPENLASLPEQLPALANRAFALFSGVAAFAGSVITAVLEFVKESLLGWLSEHAHAIPGFRLLTVILGRNPFTDEPVLRTAENLIGGFITLLPGGEAVYEELASTGVIAEAAGRIESAIETLGITWELITSTFLGVWDTLSLDDLLEPVAAFGRVLERFGEPIARIFSFIRVVVETVVTLVLRLMNFPAELLGSIIAQTVQAIDAITRDPVAFLRNLLAALKAGFEMFFTNILTHLVQGLADWLFRGLSALGITLPSDLSLGSVVELVLQVLGLSMEFLWRKLGEHIGEDRVEMIRGAIDRLGQAWAFIADVQQRGLAAIWEYLADQLSGLWDAVLGMAQEWIMTTIIQNVTARLLSMLDPTGVMAVVNSMIAFFNAVQSAIEYLHDILAIINEWVSTIAEIALGNILPGAQRLESALASAIPVAIGFLANQVGLGDLPRRIVAIIERVREMVERAFDWLISNAIRVGGAAIDALGLGGTGEDPAAADPASDGLREPFTLAGAPHEIYEDTTGRLMVSSDPEPVSALEQLSAANQRYRALPEDATQTQRRTIIREMIAILRSNPNLLSGLSEGETIGHAPNIGDIAAYGRQLPRFSRDMARETQEFAPLWVMRAEHVMPFDLGRSLWAAVSLAVPGRGGWEDRAQTTILIYEGAADLKTDSVERAISSAFVSEIERRQIPRLLRAGVVRDTATAQTSWSGSVGGTVTEIRGAVDRAEEISVARTWEAVQMETLESDEHGSTRRARRGGDVAPTRTRIAEAADQQGDDLFELVARALLES